MKKINRLISGYNHNQGSISRIKYIVIHYVGALGGAKENCQYYAGGNRNASAHYFVGFDGEIWQSVEESVMDTLKNATSVRAASDAVLTGYEKPADQSENVKKQRAGYGDGYYRKYAGGAVAPAIKKLYRVRKSWKDAASQLGAFEELENAKKACKEGYTVYDWDGKAVYSKQTTKKLPYKVQIDVDDLRIRTGAGIGYAVTGEYTGRGVFTIVEEKAGKGSTAGWGKLKSGAGWVSLDYCTKLV